MGEDRILEMLVVNVQRTNARCEEAFQEWLALSKQGPTGLPHPDGVTLIRKAAVRYRYALAESEKALQQQTDYILRKIDSREDRKSEGSAHCSICDTETQHFDNGIAICLKCFAEIGSEASFGGFMLSAIVDSSDDAIVSKDLNGVIKSWNKGAEHLFGYSADEIIGKPVTILMPPERYDEESQILARVRSGERVEHYETVRRRKDGTLIDISLTVSPIKNAKDVIIGASKVARDISDRKKADAALRRANRDLEQFAFSASHDLQEPLRSIKIFSELLTERYANKFDGEALKFLEHIRRGATRMDDLVRDLLSYTQIVAAKSTNEITDANAALAVALDNLAGAIHESQAVIHSETLPRVPIHAAHLQLLFQNLIGNGIKYRSPDRPPEIVVASKLENRYFSFSVGDNGIGIDSQFSKTIFEIFKRLHGSESYPGTGIGLAICQRIVEQQGGRIWVESEPGKGSMFRFTIPC